MEEEDGVNTLTTPSLFYINQTKQETLELVTIEGLFDGTRYSFQLERDQADDLVSLLSRMGKEIDDYKKVIQLAGGLVQEKKQ